MKTNDGQATVNAVREMSESYADLVQAFGGTAEDLKKAKHLWRAANKSRLIKIGLALIAFPEPTPISETVGACFVAAGAIQQGIRNRSIYVEDVTETLRSTLKEVTAFRNSLRP